MLFGRQIGLCCMLACGLAAQVRPELIGVPRWRLSFTVSATTNGKSNDGLQFYEYSYTAKTSGTAVLTRTGDADWSGPLDATSSLNFKAVWTIPVLSFSETTDGSASGKVAPTSDLTVLDMNNGGGFTLQFQPAVIATNYKTVTKDAGGTTETTAVVQLPWTPVWATPIPYPQSGTTLSGKTVSKEVLELTSFPELGVDVEYELTYSLVPDGQEELTLEIDNTAEYQRWRPSSTTGAESGTPLSMRATVVSSTGRAPSTRVESFLWELIDTSREPGVAMNYPINSQDSRFDIDLAAEGALAIVSSDKQHVERLAMEGFSDTVKVLPYDWGGWSELKVTAVLVDGRKLTGKLKGASQGNVLLPKRAASSLISDQWKIDKGAKGDDAADDENVPVGDATKGDGLTLYEEYRGFYEAGQHVDGDPAKKDFFVRNLAGGLALPGIGKFQRLSKLAVHHKLSLLEFPDSRVINGNHIKGPHLVDQHGVIVKVDPDISGYAEASGGPGNPKMITSVNLMNDAADLNPLYLSITLAHELFHSVNVWHHGEGDEQRYWHADYDNSVREVPRITTAGGAQITIKQEPGRDITSGYLTYFTSPGATRLKRWIGTSGGQHSGFENCVMRYDCAQAYDSRTTQDLRYVVNEPLGTSLCSSPEGTGVNEPARLPQSRYGIAAPGRGNCSGQILVNDAVSAPGR